MLPVIQRLIARWVGLPAGNLRITIADVILGADVGGKNIAVGVLANVLVRLLRKEAHLIDKPAGGGHAESDSKVGENLEEAAAANFFVQLIDSVIHSALQLAVEAEHLVGQHSR